MTRPALRPRMAIRGPGDRPRQRASCQRTAPRLACVPMKALAWLSPGIFAMSPAARHPGAPAGGCPDRANASLARAGPAIPVSRCRRIISLPYKEGSAPPALRTAPRQMAHARPRAHVCDVWSHPANDRKTSPGAHGQPSGVPSPALPTQPRPLDLLAEAVFFFPAALTWPVE